MLTPVWDSLSPRISEWGNPEHVRDYADYLEGKPVEKPERFSALAVLTDPVYVMAALIYFGLSASVFAVLVSLLATRRLRKLTNQVTQPLDDETSIPGPFEVGGRDEIRLLADGMNAMRHRIAELIEQIRDRDRVRGEWVSHVSHDLRTPLMALTGVFNRARSLLDAPPERLAEGLGPLLDAAELDTRRVRDLAEDLLEMARLDIDAALALESVPPGELLRLVTQELQPIADHRGVRLEYTCPAESIELWADGRRLIRAVENITMNSLQHAASAVRLSVSARDGEVRILVEDDGPGLPGQDGEVALDGIGADPQRRDSAGLGLQVAHRIIAAHGGAIRASNQPEGGARLTINLPLDAQR
ncbi:MAG: HAMP domain-containing sensor histidine kinase [Pseudomonadota bacterium]